MNKAFCRTKKESRVEKPDKNLSLRRLEFISPESSTKNVVQEFHRQKSSFISLGTHIQSWGMGRGVSIVYNSWGETGVLWSDMEKLVPGFSSV